MCVRVYPLTADVAMSQLLETDYVKVCDRHLPDMLPDSRHPPL
jgi:hypothetical protein